LVKPKFGETTVVATATSAERNLVNEIAKLKGCKVVVLQVVILNLLMGHWVEQRIKMQKISVFDDYGHR
jgi:hypothetical protein